MVKENLSLTQLLTLIFNFLIGSTIVTGIGKELGQDAWLAVLAATFIGVGLMYGYYSFIKLMPDKNLFEIMEFCSNRPIAAILSVCYILYFFYIACRVDRTFAEMISSAILTVTPVPVITFSYMLVIAYILYLGLEVFARVSEIFTPYIIIFFFLLVTFLVAGGRVDVHLLQPIFGDGFKPIIEAIPSIVTFPFGELITFTVILTSLTEFNKGKKISFIGVVLAGFFLTAASITMLITIGEFSYEFQNFPMLSTARKVSIGQFIERIDAFVVFIMMLGILVKTSLYLYAGTKGLEYIFRIPYRYFVFPCSMLLSISSNLIAEDYADHLLKAEKVAYNIHLAFQLAIPSVLLVILIWKVKKQTRKKNGVRL